MLPRHAPSLIARNFSTPSPPASSKGGAGGFVQSLIHGTNEQPMAVLQHSKLIGRGKYVHELVKHRVLPSKNADYKRAAKEHYGSLQGGEGGQLMGSWETVAGDLDSFIHIIRHGSLDALTPALLAPVSSELLETLQSRESTLLQEFAFSPAHDNPAQNKVLDDSPTTTGKVFELRSYSLKPGSMLEWEAAWRKGIEARRRFVEPAGAWFTQVGNLHTVHHLWEFPSLSARKAVRDQAWSVSGWADTVRDTVKLAQGMSCQILVPLEWSPLK